MSCGVGVIGLHCVGLLLSAAKGGIAEVQKCFDRKAIMRFAPAGVGWACADVFEVTLLSNCPPPWGMHATSQILPIRVILRLLRCFGTRQ
eukprot:4586612-Amphidinium_carterae.1